MAATDDQIEAARRKVRNMLHAADHGNHIGELAVLRMAASDDLLAALKALNECILGKAESNASGNPEWEYVRDRVNAARAAISKATNQ